MIVSQLEVLDSYDQNAASGKVVYLLQDFTDRDFPLSFDNTARLLDRAATRLRSPRQEPDPILYMSSEAIKRTTDDIFSSMLGILADD